ncbi:hypothetical protein [Streptomyces sp. NPDC017673]|uniref:hypothetical protein n=1 Tax=unclassified Streptomyces TaxID=2593676 RepID=UPI0037A5BF09
MNLPRTRQYDDAVTTPATATPGPPTRAVADARNRTDAAAPTPASAGPPATRSTGNTPTTHARAHTTAPVTAPLSPPAVPSTRDTPAAGTTAVPTATPGPLGQEGACRVEAPVREGSPA